MRSLWLVTLMTVLVASPALADSWACKSDTFKSTSPTGIDSAPNRILTEGGADLVTMRGQYFVPDDWKPGDPLKICIDLRFPGRFQAFDVTNLRLNTRVLTSAISGGAGSKPSTSEGSDQ